MKIDISISLLFDFYKGLLTEKQKSALDMYYNMDYSLSEIADNIGITRQGARDFIKKGEAHLKFFEEKLGLVSRFTTINDTADEIAKLVSNLSIDEKDRDIINKKLSILTEINSMD